MTNRPSVAALSLQQKLPVIMGGLLLAMAIAIAAFAYGAFRSTSLRIAEGRITSVTNQFRELFRQSGVQITTRATTDAKDKAIADFIKQPTARSRAAALKALVYKGPQPEQVIASELRSRNGALLLTTSPNMADLPALEQALDGSRASAVAISPFRLVKDTLVYSVSAPVPGTDVRFVRWRHVVGARRSREQINQLIGSDAALFLGNADGSHWTDLERPSAGPPLDPSQKGPLLSYKRAGEERLGSAELIPGTPWKVAVDVPRSTILAPVRAFLSSIALIALTALLLALIVAWVLSRRMTRPLIQLTEAADAIAVGNYSHTVDIRRRDEIGRLGRSFSAMASQVQRLTAELEHRVAERTADLNAANQELESFAYAVSHDLRTPLRALDGFSQAVMEDYGDRVDATGHDYLKRIRRGSQRMGDLIDALLELSKVTRGELRRENVDLSAIAQDILTSLREHEPQRRVEAEVQPGLATTGDPRLMRALLQNLLGNAWKFTARTPDARIAFGMHEDNGHGRVHFVRDNGAGFNMEYAPRLFGAFQRLHDQKDFEGTGVGLATAQRIVRRHGGSIWAEGAPNKGASFYFTLA